MADLPVDYRPDFAQNSSRGRQLNLAPQKLCKWSSKSSYITSERTTTFLCIELPYTVFTIQISSPLKKYFSCTHNK